MPRVLSLCLALVGTYGCTSTAGDLQRAERAFTQARYEEAELWLEDLTASVPRMRPAERARYFYFVGMSAHRTGDPGQARHALALCREQLESVPEALPERWRRNLVLALSELGSPPVP